MCSSSTPSCTRCALMAAANGPTSDEFQPVRMMAMRACCLMSSGTSPRMSPVGRDLACGWEPVDPRLLLEEDLEEDWEREARAGTEVLDGSGRRRRGVPAKRSHAAAGSSC